jgi:hypothetical protein
MFQLKYGVFPNAPPIPLLQLPCVCTFAASVNGEVGFFVPPTHAYPVGPPLRFTCAEYFARRWPANRAAHLSADAQDTFVALTV